MSPLSTLGMLAGLDWQFDRKRSSTMRMIPILILLTFASPGSAAMAQHPPVISGPLVVAHRGASFDAPENTMASFRLAFARGADAIEGDFYLTGDGQIVCTHDKTTGRFNPRDISVTQSPLAELQKLDVGAWKDARYTGERMPTLRQVLDFVPDHKRIFVEAKAGPEIAGPMLAVFDKADIRPEQITVIAFDAELVAELERLRPQLHTCWLTSFKQDRRTGAWRPSAEEVVARAKEISTDGVDVHANMNVVNERFVQLVRQAGLELHCWTVNDYGRTGRLRELGVDSITTDRPGLLREVLSAPPLAKTLVASFGGEGEATQEASSRTTTWRKAAAPVFVIEHRDGLLRDPVLGTGVFGPALDMRDGKSFVQLGRALPREGTLAMWLRVPRFENYVTLFDTPAHADEWECWIDARGRVSFRDHRAGATVRHALHPRADLARWIHIAVTWRELVGGASALCLFVDGRQVSQAKGRRPSPKPGPRLHLGGAQPDNQAGRFELGETALFDAPLGALQIDTLYRDGLRKSLH
jgi:glycerophosphoryl diester phosphodiesterase